MRVCVGVIAGSPDAQESAGMSGWRGRNLWRLSGPEEIVVAATQALCLVAAGADSRRSIMSTGTVKWFNPTKGYGFIQPQGGGQDVFVHISAVERAGLSTLNEGQQVEYEVVSNRGKSSAENLKVK
jgi:cold shock protein